MFDLSVPEGWRLVKLSDLGEVNRGRSRHRPRDAAHLYGGTYPFVQTGDIKASGGRVTNYTQTYNEDGLAQSRLWPTGTMCITIAANIAETGVLQFPACFPDSVIGFIPDKSQCNVYFIEYVFRLLRRRIQAQATGSVQDNINLQTLELLLFPIPDLEEQNRIAAVLCSFDDKIELNHQTNQTLENIAQAIFKSWFVDFEPTRAKVIAKEKGGDKEAQSLAAQAVICGAMTLEQLSELPAEFPKREGKLHTLIMQRFRNTPSAGLDKWTAESISKLADQFPNVLVDSELGKIPEGWGIVRFKGIIEKYIDNRGKTPPVVGSGIPLLEVKHLPENSIKPDLNTTKYVDEETYDNWFRAHLEADDIIISTVGTIGRICMVPKNEKISIAQNLLGMRFSKEKVSPYFMYYQMDGFRFRHDVDARLVITVQASIKRKDLETIDLLSPPVELQNLFEAFVKPFVSTQQSNQEIALAKVRDELLPKLLSGEVNFNKLNMEVTECQNG